MVDLLHQVLFAAEQLADLKADLCVLIGIERCDAALGGTKGLRSQTGFFHAVQCFVVRHNDLAAVGDEDIRHRNALFRYRLELVDEVFNGERNAVANDIEDVLSKNTGGQLMQSKATVIGDDRVAGVAAALETNNDIGIFRQNIGDFAFSFVAPAGADNCFYHNSSSLSNIYLFLPKAV